MFENHKPHHHKTAAALFFQSKKIFLPRFVACPDEQTAGVGEAPELGAWGQRGLLKASEASGCPAQAWCPGQVRRGQQATRKVIRTQSTSRMLVSWERFQRLGSKGALQHFNSQWFLNTPTQP